MMQDLASVIDNDDVPVPPSLQEILTEQAGQPASQQAISLKPWRLVVVCRNRARKSAARLSSISLPQPHFSSRPAIYSSTTYKNLVGESSIHSRITSIAISLAAWPTSSHLSNGSTTIRAVQTSRRRKNQRCGQFNSLGLRTYREDER